MTNNPFKKAADRAKQQEQQKHEQIGAYVRGETDSPPAEMPKAPPKSKPRSFAELILKNKQKPAKKEQDILRGTGLTKRTAERADRQFEKHQQTFQPVSPPDIKKPSGGPAEYGPKSLNIQFTQDKEIELDEYQSAALRGIRNQQYACLIGAAGTGKTTVTKALIRQIINDIETIQESAANAKRGENMPGGNYIPAIAACAYTGTATENVRKALGTEFQIRVDTIHGLLGFYPVKEPYFDEKAQEYKERMKFVPYYTAENPMPWKVILIDEAGMLGIDLWHMLLDACLPDCRIIMIGDINQLPPVQGRSVLGFAMLNWPTFALEKIHRQAEDSPIISNAHRILRGQMPIPDKKGFIVYNCPGGGIDTFQRVLQLVQGLDQKGIFKYLEDAIITSVTEDMLGQKHFNQKLLPYFNGPKYDENNVNINPRYTVYGGRTQVAFANGDKVMVLANDRERGITNGMIGVVINVAPNPNYTGKMGGAQMANFDFSDADFDDLDFDEDDDDTTAEPEEEEAKRQASHVVTVRFQHTDFEFRTSGDMAKLAHAYAFTCHKSQGKEYPNVIIVLHSKNAIMLSREWLYTAVTRAQQRVFLCCNNRGLQMALQRQNIKGNTIKEKAESFIALMDKKDTKIPELPMPREIK